MLYIYLWRLEVYRGVCAIMSDDKSAEDSSFDFMSILEV